MLFLVTSVFVTPIFLINLSAGSRFFRFSIFTETYQIFTSVTPYSYSYPTSRVNLCYFSSFIVYVSNVHVCTVHKRKRSYLSVASFRHSVTIPSGWHAWWPGYTQIIYYNQVHVATRPFYQTFYTLYVYCSIPYTINIYCNVNIYRRCVLNMFSIS